MQTNKVPDISGLVKKADYNSKITEIGSKIPSISDLATPVALIAIKNEISDSSNLVKKTDCDAKISDVENEYTTTIDYNRFLKILLLIT